MKNTHVLLQGLLACAGALAVAAFPWQGRLVARPGTSSAHLSAPPPQNVGRPRAGTLCAADERVIFSCAVRGSSKLVSLCGSKTLTKDEGYIQYRFGRAGRVELEFPKDRGGSQKLFSYEHVFRYQFDQTEIGFESGGYAYTLFDYYDGEQKPARKEAGVRVRAAGENAEETTLRCAGRTTARYGDLTEILPGRDN